jgi:hypothetical protein
MATKDVSVVLAHGAWAMVELGACHNGARGPWPEGVRGARAVDVASRRRGGMPGPVVLAAHPYAGAVIALARPERVKALV